MAFVGFPIGTEVTDSKYILSSVSEIPEQHHFLVVALAAVLAFKKGTNPSSDSVAQWQGVVDSMIPTLVNDVETRQGSDIETLEAYLEDEYE